MVVGRRILQTALYQRVITVYPVSSVSFTDFTWCHQLHQRYRRRLSFLKSWCFVDHLVIPLKHLVESLHKMRGMSAFMTIFASLMMILHCIASTIPQASCGDRNHQVSMSSMEKICRIRGGMQVTHLIVFVFLL